MQTVRHLLIKSQTLKKGKKEIITTFIENQNLVQGGSKYLPFELNRKGQAQVCVIWTHEYG